jgi:hypothetical protein
MLCDAVIQLPRGSCPVIIEGGYPPAMLGSPMDPAGDIARMGIPLWGMTELRSLGIPI